MPHTDNGGSRGSKGLKETKANKLGDVLGESAANRGASENEESQKVEPLSPVGIRVRTHHHVHESQHNQGQGLSQQITEEGVRGGGGRDMVPGFSRIY